MSSLFAVCDATSCPHDRFVQLGEGDNFLFRTVSEDNIDELAHGPENLGYGSDGPELSVPLRMEWVIWAGRGRRLQEPSGQTE